jgi:hypothetical protein
MRAFLTLNLLVISLSAQAIVFPPVTIPTSPTAGQPFQFSISTDSCDFFRLDQPVVRVIGNRVEAELIGSPSQSPPFCLAPPGTYVYNLPALPAAGAYILGVYRRETPSFLVVRLVQTTTFTVQAPIVSVPTLAWSGLGLLIISILSISMISFKGKQ